MMPLPLRLWYREPSWRPPGTLHLSDAKIRVSDWRGQRDCAICQASAIRNDAFRHYDCNTRNPYLSDAKINMSDWHRQKIGTLWTAPFVMQVRSIMILGGSHHHLCSPSGATHYESPRGKKRKETKPTTWRPQNTHGGRKRERLHLVSCYFLICEDSPIFLVAIQKLQKLSGQQCVTIKRP